jgi:S-formylglutathione hydrolase
VSSQLRRGSFRSDLVPDEVEYALLVADGIKGPPSLVYCLHGGMGSAAMLERLAPVINGAWQRRTLRPCIFAMPSVGRSLYMNFRDGSQRWEDLLVGPLLDHLRHVTGASPDRQSTAFVGLSMGGLGALRMTFKYPELAIAVAAVEPGIEPALEFSNLTRRDRSFRDDALYERIFGSPVDGEYWAANNPATMAYSDPTRLRDSGLAISFECGDADSLGSYRGAEYLHRILFDAGVSHEYRLVRGADHIGPTVMPRFAQALAFVGSVFDPPDPGSGPSSLKEYVERNRARARAGRPEGRRRRQGL